MEPNETPAPPVNVTTQLYHGDCFDVMPTLAPGSVAMVFADVPYATAGRQVTANAWDVPFDLQTFWKGVRHVTADHAVTAMTAKVQIACALMRANSKLFRYDLIWDKKLPSRHLHAKRMPLLRHEMVLIFYKPPGCYRPQMELRDVPKRRGRRNIVSHNWLQPNDTKLDPEHVMTHRYPTTIIEAKRENYTIHPTQKPVALLEYLIKTYTYPGDTVLDPVAGSMTTAVACLRTGRHCIAIERDADYFAIGQKRVADERAKLGMVPM